VLSGAISRQLCSRAKVISLDVEIAYREVVEFAVEKASCFSPVDFFGTKHAATYDGFLAMGVSPSLS